MGDMPSFSTGTSGTTWNSPEQKRKTGPRFFWNGFDRDYDRDLKMKIDQRFFRNDF
jgi:hypothetical protein